ncbi:hypothetical protein MMC18_006148 [Xylographa bjoerkii]|nr:hypothetical protein [Xylographa bjoerkii]
MAGITIEEIIGQSYPIESPKEEDPIPPSPFIIYDNSDAPAERNAAVDDNQHSLPRMYSPAGPYIAPDGSIEACPSPEEATQWFPDDAASLRIADPDLRAMVDRILLSPEYQPPRARFLACAVVKHFSYWLWLMKDKHHPFESYMARYVSVILNNSLQKAISTSGLDEFEQRTCTQIEALVTKQVFASFPELCAWTLDKNWATLAELIDPRTDEPPVVENDVMFGGFIRAQINAMKYVLRRKWTSLEFLCDGERFTVEYRLIMVWEAQRNRLKDLSGHCEKLLGKVETREARVLREVSGNAQPDADRVFWYEGKENQPPVVEQRFGDGEGSFPEWQERMLRRLGT